MLSSSFPGLALALASTAACQIRQLSLAAEIKYATPLDGFISYSLEFFSLPDFAGNSSHPNKFSDNLLNNIGYLQGTKPYIRVGGNTQDFAIYNSSLTTALEGTMDVSRSPDYPTTLEIGPSFFESYTTWPNVKFSHGFNMGGNNDSRVHATLLQTVPLACKALGEGKLYTWEYGNEADLFATTAQGPVRSLSYNESDYVEEWLEGTQAIREAIQEACPSLSGNDALGFMAPSFAGTDNHLLAQKAWASGLDADSDVQYFSSHNYISGANSPGVTLQGTLMNHTQTMLSVDAHVAEYEAINPGIPHIFGEANSLYNQGRPGLSNTFGAALWGIDFCLYSASVGIGRVHLHMGTDYRYQSWQPTTTNRTTIGTKAPYYGNVAVAAFLGNQRVAPVQIAHLPLAGSDHEAAYAAYVNGVLRRIMVINLNTYNYSSSLPTARPNRLYSLNLGSALGNMTATLQRLHANGSDAITGITWDGWSYNYELAQGKPIRLRNVTVGETLKTRNGLVNVAVPDSQAVIVNLET